MSLSKKYFYLKLKDNFFDREEIRVIQGLENGDTYVCIILEMYLRSLKRNGILMMSERIPYSIRTLSSVLKRRQDEIKYAIDLFKEFGLVEILNSGAIFMADIQDFIGESSTEADRKRAYRTKIEVEKKESFKHLENGTSVQTSVRGDSNKSDEIVQKRPMSDKCPDVSPPEIEIELKTELELELKEKNAREENSHANAQKTDTENADKNTRFKKPTIDEIQTYVNQQNLINFNTGHFFDHYESNGWMIGRTKMKSWQHAVYNWHRRSQEFGNCNGSNAKNQSQSMPRTGLDGKSGYYNDLDQIPF
ncbi:phage replisome organizer N-terminal domain-containing protein [Caedibacter taeniospiralis]|uniref:phage replisome organizer N-terminal domain-containing protein n=1 Tax=Caedibacter taeniospiralis TaxID=28907 RepID=UPI000C27040E|nr:phage replisome organizer N-terminal domain-containing protein [Caedibacter taeniospiralis]